MAHKDLDILKSEAKRRIRGLVEDYMQVLAKGRKEAFNEERVKIAFVVPMLEALGWNPRTDEVLPEQATLTGRADFGLRVGGRTKVFVEMKRFSKSLDGHYTVKGRPRSFAEQAIQYAWGMKASWAVLTNFEETRLYDSHVKKAEDGLVWKKTMRFTEYESRFDELWLVSKQSVVSGALDAYKAKIERPPVDKAFLNDLMNCRQLLAEDIKNNNPSVAYDQINESVQKILDRLIFIKNCEDRLIIPAESLWKRYKAWQETAIDKEIVIFMMDLKNLFRYFDKVYNGKLFEKHVCEDLKISNEVLEEIIDTLYGDGQHLGYNFSAIPVDVLGQAYELYIGSIIKEKEGKAKGIEIAKQPARRKAHGIYYTPEPVVDYIVRGTLGRVLEKCKTPKDVSRIKVLDPACGSGSFLIKAFDMIREWYENYNKLNRPISVSGTLDAHIVPVPNPEERILTENLYGVDLDPQAVEITILNLSLKAVKAKEKLPYMADHIKCGNSLISDEKIAGDKAFNWNVEFEEIIKEGGFNVVIGNPPYVRQEELSEIKPYLAANYETYQGMADLFVYFFEKELKMLKEDGYFGMIVSNKWLRAGYGKNLRKFLTGFWIEEFIDFGDLRVFADATIYPCIMIIRKIKKPNPKIRICKIETLGFGSLGEYIRNNSFFIDQSELSEKEWNIQKTEANELLKKLRASGLPLVEYVGAKICYGIKTGLNKAFIIDEKKREELIRDDSRNDELIKPVLTGAECKRYVVKSKKNYIILTRIGVEVERCQAIYRHLCNFKGALEKRWDKGNYWYELRACSYYDLFDGPKIVWGNLATRSSFSLDEKSEFYVNAPACILPTDSKYVLGILNSKLMSYFLKSICAERQGGFIEQMPVYVSQVPIKKPTKEQEIEITQHVEKMLQLNEKLLKIGDKLTDERAGIEKEIKKTDSEIDELVYGIYGITVAEKEIIEESSRNK